MNCLNIRNDYIFGRLLNAKRNKDLVKVGEDFKGKKYYYIGNEVFLRTNKEDDSFDLMELPVSKENSGNVAMITVIPSKSKIKFYAPLCSGCQVVVAEAEKKGLYWHYRNKASCFENQTTSLKYTLDVLSENSRFYGKNAPIYAASLTRIISNVCDFESSKEKVTGVSLKKEKK